jgi:Asp-tRNA(Asn)/Glu-tRNA(Gln) amidotransferase A subunit family amidase
MRIARRENVFGNDRRSVNSAYGARSLPIGLQIIGRRFDDPAVPAIARAFEAMRPRKHGRGPSRRRPD